MVGLARGYGVKLAGRGTARNLVVGNLIGLDLDGTQKGNDMGGVRIDDDATHNRLGRSCPAWPDALSGWANVVLGNYGPGVAIDGPVTSGNVLRCNQVRDNGDGSSEQQVALSSGANGARTPPTLAIGSDGSIHVTAELGETVQITAWPPAVQSEAEVWPAAVPLYAGHVGAGPTAISISRISPALRRYLGTTAPAVRVTAHRTNAGTGTSGLTTTMPLSALP